MIVIISKGNIKTTVNEELFEARYKPEGWKIDSYEVQNKKEIELTPEEFVVKQAKEESVKNYNASKKSKVKKFDDNIIKED